MKKIIVFKVFMICVLLAAIGTLGYLYQKKPEIQIVNQQIEVNTDVKISDMVKVISGGKLVNGSIFLDSSTVGEKDITVTMKNVINAESSYQLKYNVIDTQPPVIKAADTLFLVKGSAISDVMSQLEITDNSNKETTYTISGDYNLEAPEKYRITVNVSDASGNVTSIERDLIVEISGGQAEYFTTSKGFAGYVKDGLTFIDGVLIANKTYTLPRSYGKSLTEEFTGAFNRMKEAAAADGVNIYIKSGFRSYDHQEALFNMYVKQDSLANALTYSAKPGHSEHQTGLAADLNLIAETFENTAAFRWLNANCYKYGFILRYTKNGEGSTGYIYEPWHYRYIGERLAEILYNNGDWITVEDYFGITSQYSD